MRVIKDAILEACMICNGTSEKMQKAMVLTMLDRPNAKAFFEKELSEEMYEAFVIHMCCKLRLAEIDPDYRKSLTDYAESQSQINKQSN